MLVRNWSFILGNDILIEKWYFYWNLIDIILGLYLLCKLVFCIILKILIIWVKRKKKGKIYFGLGCYRF